MPKIAANATAAPTTCGGGPPWMPVLWTAVWPLPRASSQRLTGTVRTKATTSANERLPQNSSVSRPACIAPGTMSMISVVDDLHRRDRERVRGQRDRDHGGEREARLQQRQAGQRVAEEEGEGDGQDDRREVREPERRADRHPGDLADRAAGEAVQRGADGDAGQGACPRWASRGGGRVLRVLPRRAPIPAGGMGVATLADTPPWGI